MKYFEKYQKRKFHKKIVNTAFLLIFSIIAITSYYTANFSKAKDIIEVNVNIKDTIISESIEKCKVNATEGIDGESFYVKLPKYINNKKVIKYSYSTENAGVSTDTEQTVENEVEKAVKAEQNVPLNQIGPNDILPESKIYLTSTEVKKQELTILAHYDIREQNGKNLYNQYIEDTKDNNKITVSGYMPENAKLIIQEVDKKEAQTTIRQQSQRPIILAVAYDIKIQCGEDIYEPYEFDQNINVKIEKEDLKEKETNVWHIDDKNKVEKLEQKPETNDIEFVTNGFSIFGLEDVEATELALDGMADSILTIDDAESDKYYWQGQNYTEDTTGENKNIYTEYANVTVNYHGYGLNEVEPEKIGYVSLTEKYNIVTYKKTAPIVSGNISIELVDNPFIDRPTGYGFGGWTSPDGIISTDTKTKTQTITATGSKNVTLNIYANWKTATVVYLNSDGGNDNLNDGLSPETPFGSWSRAYEYLYNNSQDRTDRENNIIVLTGNIDSTMHGSRTVTGSQTMLADVTYESSTTFTSGEKYILATGTGEGSNALAGINGSIGNATLSTTEKPPAGAEWIIQQSGNGYTIKNNDNWQYLHHSRYSGLYFSDSSFTWTYDSNNRRFYYQTTGWRRTTYYLRYNNGTWTTTTNANSAQSFYFLKCKVENERPGPIVNTKSDNIGSNNNYTSSRNVASTITSLYGHVDYRDNAIMDLTQNNYRHIYAYADLQIEYLNINATGYTRACGTDGISISTRYPVFYGRAHNFRIGRGIKQAGTSNDASTAGAVIGGFESGTTVGSTYNSNNAYKLVIESGKYSSILAWNMRDETASYYGTVNWTLGNDIDRVLKENSQLKSYFRNTVNAGGGVNGRANVRDKAYLINVKSGTFGVDAVTDGYGDAYTSGIYMGGYGTGSSSGTRDISDRYMIVEGGLIYNINCGLKVDSGKTDILTKLYVKGGEIYNIVGGAGLSTTYGSRIQQITGGKIRYSVSGGSNGYSGSDGDGQISNCNTLVYIGGNAQIGDETLVGYITDNNTSNDDQGKLYLVEAGCVLGAGNGSNPNYTAGQVDNSHIIIADEAHILNSVYGGGNYGIVGNRNGTTAKATIDILGGTVDRNVYGGSNNSSIFGSTTVNVKGGHVKGAVYGGTNTSGTVSSTATVNVTGGILGNDTNAEDNEALFGGGYGQSTTVSGKATVNILDTSSNVYIYGSAYGGSSLGRMNSNVEVNIQDIPGNSNIISIVGSVFAGGKGTTTTSATIAGSATLNIDGSNLPDCSVFGGNDINGTTSGAITVNVGRTYESKLKNAYGGGNKAGITTTTPSVRVYLLSNSNVTNAFNGGRAANLTSSGTSDTTRAIYLQGGKAKNIFGGSDSSGTVTASHVYIESGTAENVYGGNNIGGTTNTTYVYVTGGTVTNTYGGGYQASTPATNVSLTGGTVTNGFGGGNAADVTNTSISLAGSTATNIYGGSNEKGTVSSTYVTINSGTVTNVYGGNNAGGNSVNTEVIVNSSTENVYGGGNEAITSGNTLVTLHNATITGSAFGGGNGAAAIVSGNSVITADGTTNIAQDLFGGGNAAATGSSSKTSKVTVDISGGTIGGDVYGAANTSVVTGETHVNIGTTVVSTTGLTQGTIDIAGTVFGGGKSNTAGSEDYDFSFESVIGNTYIDINAENYDNGTYTYNIRKSIFGAGNAATMSGDGYINITNYGKASDIKQNISIQRATTVTIDNSVMYLEGTTDRTNEISTAVYTLNRIKELKVKNNTTLYLASGANILEKLTSIDSSEAKATVTIGPNGVLSRNVDNRIYLLQGKNLILKTEAGAHGEVYGMTYVGLFKGILNRDTGIYGTNYNHGDTVPADYEEFARNSYVQGKHYDGHDIKIDGFYTNYEEDGVIATKYIEPTPESAPYYQWILGKVSDDIYYDEIELIATKYATTSTYVLDLTGLDFPNMTVNVIGFDTSELRNDVILKDNSEIPNIEMDATKANTTFGLTMTAGNTGWQTKGTTAYYTSSDNQNNGTFSGTEQYLSDNSTTTPSFSFYMGHSKNVSTNEVLGSVTIHLQVSYVSGDELILRNVYIPLRLSTNNTFKLATDFYEGAITPGKKYSMFPTTNTSITSNSSFSAYYSLYLGGYSQDQEYYDNFVGYNHYLVSSCVLPAKTKITFVDRSKDEIKYYYYIVTDQDEQNARKEYKFQDFTAMGSTDEGTGRTAEKYNNDSSYLNTTLDIVLEEFIFQVDFADITLANTFANQSLTVQLRDMWDDSVKLKVNTDQYPMLFNLYSDKEAIKSVDVNSNKTYIYMGNEFKVDLKTVYEFQTENADTVYDTTHFEDQLGVKITVLEGSTQLSSTDLTGIYVEYNGKRYYARTDGSYRIKIADAVSNVLTDMVFYTENGKLDTATYTFKFETFGSIDGVYFSSAIATDSINMQIINADYGLSAILDDKSVLIDKATGITKNNDNALDFTIGYSAEFTNPKICVSLYRRDYSSIYSSKYNLIDLANYVSNTLTPTAVEKEYLVTDNPQATQNFVLRLKDNLTTGTYKIVFSLYDGENYIGNIDKMIIIK